MKKAILIIVSVILSTVAFQSCNQDDLKIRQNVENVLEDKYPSVFVSVDNGVVTLTGIVDSLSIRERAEKEILSINNVKKVDNKIEVYKAEESTPQNP